MDNMLLKAFGFAGVLIACYFAKDYTLWIIIVSCMAFLEGTVMGAVEEVKKHLNGRENK